MEKKICIEKIRDIELRFIERIIPKKLYMKFNIFNIHTLDDVLKMDAEDFSNYDGVGHNTLSLFEDFKNKVINDPESVYSICNQNTVERENKIKSSENIKNVELKFLNKIIPTRLYKKLLNLGMRNIQSILATDEINFSGKRGVGRNILALYENFRGIVLNEPDYILRKSIEGKDEMEPTLPLERSINESKNQSNLFLHFKNIVADYFSLKGDIRDKEIIFKRFGLNDERLHTLDELGILFEITCEGIRRVELKHLRNIKILLEGRKLIKPPCKCNDKIVQDLKSFVGKLTKSKKTLGKSGCKHFIEENFAIDISNNDLPYISLLMAVYGIKEFSFRDSEFFLIDKQISSYKLIEVCEKIYRILKKEVRPISYYDLIIETKKALKHIRKNLYIDEAITIINDIEERHIAGKTYYQLKFQYLHSLSDMAYRILFEKNMVLDYRDIYREIMHRLAKSDANKKFTARSMSTQIYQDPRFKSVGGTGKWALKDFEANTEPIIDLIKKALYKYNEPRSIKDIFEYIKGLRSSININSIRFYLNDSKRPFLKLRDGTYIMAEWKEDYIDLLHHPLSRLSPSQFNELLIKIFEDHNMREMSTNELVKLIKRDYNAAESSIANRLPRSKILEKKHFGGKNSYRLVENYKDILIQKRVTKFLTIEDSIRDILKISNNCSVLQSKLIRELADIYGYSEATINHVINKSLKFVKMKGGRGKNTVTFSDEYIEVLMGEPELIDDRSISALIELGESETLEFKSTLQWDVRENKLNKGLRLAVLKTIVAFLNSAGGTLLIGVEDTGNVYGLDKDLQFVKEKTLDGFRQTLANLIGDYIGKEYSTLIKFRFDRKDGHDVCIVTVDQSTTAVFTKKPDQDFYIRLGSTTQKLDVKETIEYNKQHWKGA